MAFTPSKLGGGLTVTLRHSLGYQRLARSGRDELWDNHMRSKRNCCGPPRRPIRAANGAAKTSHAEAQRSRRRMAEQKNDSAAASSLGCLSVSLLSSAVSAPPREFFDVLLIPPKRPGLFSRKHAYFPEVAKFRRSGQVVWRGSGLRVRGSGSGLRMFKVRCSIADV